MPQNLSFNRRRHGDSSFNRRRHGVVTSVRTTILTLLVACLGCSDTTSSQPKLLLYCGAGIRPPVAELAKRFGSSQSAQFVNGILDKFLQERRDES